LVVLGDCYFTEDAVDAMCQPVSDWTLYCRPGPSTITGKPYGECWAFSLPEHTHQRYRETLVWLAGMGALGETGRCGGWPLYRALLNQNLNDHTMTTNYQVIDDWSEDFDYPHDFDMWSHRRSVPTPLSERPVP
jgi:hypothetical protein